MSISPHVTMESTAAPEPEQPKRHRCSIAEKRRIVEDSFRPEASVARVARTHGVNANQVFSWRRLYRLGRLGGAVAAPSTAELLPVTISEPPPGTGGTPGPLAAPYPAGTIQLQLPRGRLRIEGAVDTESLRLVLQSLLA